MTENQLMRGKYVVIDLQAQSQQVATQVDQLNGLAGDAGRVINVILQNGRDQQGNPLPYDLTGKTVALCAKDAQGKVKISRMMTRENGPMGMFSLEVPAPFYATEGRIQDGYIGVFNSNDLNLVIGSMPITFEVRHNSLLVGTGDGISQAFDSQFNAIDAKANKIDNRIGDLNDRISNQSSAINAYTKLINDKQVLVKGDIDTNDINNRIKAVSDKASAVNSSLEGYKAYANQNIKDNRAFAQGVHDKFDGKVDDLWNLGVNPVKRLAEENANRLNSDNDRINDINNRTTDWSVWLHDSGISMTNGATRYMYEDTDVFYRTRKVGGATQVHIRFTCKGIWTGGKVYINLPTALSPAFPVNTAQPCRNNAVANWEVKDTAISLRNNTDNNYDKNDYYNFSFVYEAKG